MSLYCWEIVCKHICCDTYHESYDIVFVVSPTSNGIVLEWDYTSNGTLSELYWNYITWVNNGVLVLDGIGLKSLDGIGLKWYIRHDTIH